MILLDTNVLIYATDVRAPQHAASRRVVDAVIAAVVPGAIVTQVLVEYVGVSTGPTMESPLSTDQAVAQIQAFRRQIRTFDPPPTSLDYLAAIVTSTGRAGRRTLDYYLAAQALALGITTICTYNISDFSGIQGISTITPDDVRLPVP